ncbi:LysR family transcriptional regulator [Acetobacter sp.]|uniref:LysR family transcriptional regulator n=1 Tax=Acetobacter sp. TaxID=440 RepID=UPI0025B99966|nr:LysR family transcriptional regulator [Acetobacter sp.]MCH4090818.1 LysR family transcriptional regulator [Acetobacter sp.]MCI1300466.1 LysR family transcriptional regulator [Acetobacter sp.]MCI1316332.1 LysR family transcriptional regulator [Acetobacter sp.]
MDRIDLLRVFIRVMETGNFSRAAGSLNLPRSSVSTAIQQLETKLGTRLFSRTTRLVSPTTDGKVFYERALQLVADMEDMESLFQQKRGSPRGLLRVEMPGRIGRLIVAPALPTFLAAYPEIDIQLGVTDRSVNLMEDGVDCALRVGTLADSSLISRHIADLQVINVASPLYLKTHGILHTPQDIPDHQVIRYASPATGRIEEWEWVYRGESKTCPVQGRVTVNSAEALIACCLAGAGLMQIPAYDVRNHLISGELVEVLTEWRAPPLPLTFLYPERRHRSSRLQVFADWISELLKNQL